MSKKQQEHTRSDHAHNANAHKLKLPMHTWLEQLWLPLLLKKTIFVGQKKQDNFVLFVQMGYCHVNFKVIYLNV